MLTTTRGTPPAVAAAEASGAESTVIAVSNDMSKGNLTTDA